MVVAWRIACSPRKLRASTCLGRTAKAWSNGAPNWVFWHHWPDSKIHDVAVAGQGLDTPTKDAADQLTSDDFWSFVERLATGRRLVITSDHGYAATGYFPDAEGDVGQHLKKTFQADAALLVLARQAHLCRPWRRN